MAQHNTTIPHAAFDGQTPDEIYFGTGAAIPDQLAERRKKARQAASPSTAPPDVVRATIENPESFRACRNCERLTTECQRTQESQYPLD